MVARRGSKAIARLTVIFILIAIIFAACIIGVLLVFVFFKPVPLPRERGALPGGDYQIGRELGDAYSGFG